MVELSLDNSLAEKIYARWKQRGDAEPRRQHLGASIIGNRCKRETWQQFRWVSEAGFPGRIYRLFNTGKREEVRLIEDLKAIGIEVLGEQVTFESDENPHLSATSDLIARGFEEAPALPHIVSFKTTNRFDFQKLEKTHSVKEVFPEYFDQVQLEMALSKKYDRAVVIIVCKDTDAIYSERVKLLSTSARELVSLAGKIVELGVPEKISEDAGHKECKYCVFMPQCHGAALVARNCRTCRWSKPSFDTQRRNVWLCQKHSKELSYREQISGCDDYGIRDDLQRKA